MTAIIIPIYKIELNSFEKISIDQCFRIFIGRNIVFIHPESLDLSFYKKRYSNAKFIPFPNLYFESIRAYNILLTSKEFYKRFIDIEFILIHQTDSYVFYDELDSWIEKRYDYLGAPWIRSTQDSELNYEFVGVGNGGFSLRNNKKMAAIVFKIERIKRIYFFLEKLLGSYFILKRIKFILKIIFRLPLSKKSDFLFSKKIINEDFYWSQRIPQIFDFKVAPVHEAIAFSFEVSPQILFSLNRNRLPFGCHAWEKYDYQFWKSYLVTPS